MGGTCSTRWGDDIWGNAKGPGPLSGVPVPEAQLDRGSRSDIGPPINRRRICVGFTQLPTPLLGNRCGDVIVFWWTLMLWNVTGLMNFKQ
jgi:hypothetical protein